MNCMNNFIKTDKVKKEEYSNIVYKINYHDWNYSYVGQTKRKLRMRIKEYINDLKNLLILCLLSLVTNLIMILQLIGKMLVFSIQNNLIIKGWFPKWFILNEKRIA